MIVFDAPATAPIAAAQAAVVSSVLLVLGWLIADALVGRSVDACARFGLAFAGLMGFALSLILVHMATGGALLSNAPLTRAATLVPLVILGALKWRQRPRTKPSGETWLLVAVVGLAVALWGLPLTRDLPVDFSGDTPLHMGWSNQLLNGETTPSATITGDIPNFYPWLAHALTALVANLTPGGRAVHALAPLQLLQVVGATSALFAVGRALGRSALSGAAAAVAGSLTGGFGWLIARKLDIVMKPRADDALRYAGDLVQRRSYNSSFYQLAPAWPRDFAYVLLISAVLMMILGLRAADRRPLIGAGAVLGLAGLTGAEAFYLGMGTCLCAVAASTKMKRLHVAAALLVPSIAISSLWFGPQLVTYMRLGFANITRVEPVELPAYAILAAWGIITPLSLFGLTRVTRRRIDPGLVPVLGLVVVSGAVIAGASLVPDVLGQAFMSIGRAHRYWPLLHAGLALFAALGAARLLERAGRRGRPALIVSSAALLVATLPSIVVANLALPDGKEESEAIRTATRAEPRSLLNLVAPEPGERCVAAVPPALDVVGWSFTGYRLVMYEWLNVPDNPARIRWARIYESLTPIEERLEDNRLLTRGAGSPAEWRAAAAKYGVDVVVAHDRHASGAGFEGTPSVAATDLPYRTFRLSECGT